MAGNERSALREREKELDFVYALVVLLARPSLSAEEAAEGTARLFASAMGEPERARIRVSIGDVSAEYPTGAQATPGDRPTDARIEAIAGAKAPCLIQARYATGSPPATFSEREESLCSSAVAILAVAAERLEADARERSYRDALERKNAALSELLSLIEMEKSGMRASIRSAIDERVAPLVARLAGAVRRGAAPDAHASGAGGMAESDGYTGDEASRLEARIRREIDAALSRSDAAADDPRRRLSVRELEICDLVASGLTSKEIGERLSIAKATVERHRHNARRKLGMPDREGSIASALGRQHGDLY